MATSPARRPSSITLDDRELAELSVAGDGDAFAQLYDRHERRVYGFCLRMLGTPDDAAEATQETFMRLLRRLPALEGRDVNFVAYALTTARNACYDTIAARRRVEPVAEQIEASSSEPGEIAIDPERAALLASAREDVRVANARLPERQREVLALRELEQMSYEQIGEVVNLNGNAVAQLISRARIRLREELRGGALQSIATSSPDCERALGLMARLQDTQRSTAEERDWLHRHLSSCETCGCSCAAMQEAGVSYRALGPIVPLIWLRHTTIARAARFVGADWSHLTGFETGATAQSSTPTPSVTAQFSTPAPGARSPIDPRIAADGHKGVSGRNWTAMGRIRSLSAVRARGPMDRRLRWILATAILCAILVVVLAGSVTPDNRALPRTVTVTPALSSATAARANEGQHRHPTRLAYRASAPAGTSLAHEHSAALALAVRGAGGQPSIPAQAVHHARHVGHHRSTRRAHPAPVTPTSGAPVPQPPTTTPTITPTATTPSPSPPSSGSSGGSTGSGSGTSTGGGETPPVPAQTPGSPPGGPTGTGPGGTRTVPGCTTSFACP